MPLLSEPTTSSTSTAPANPADPGAGRPTSARLWPGRRRGARVRARTVAARPWLNRRARRTRGQAWDVEAFRLPEPLLTALIPAPRSDPQNRPALTPLTLLPLTQLALTPLPLTPPTPAQLALTPLTPPTLNPSAPTPSALTPPGPAQLALSPPPLAPPALSQLALTPPAHIPPALTAPALTPPALTPPALDPEDQPNPDDELVDTAQWQLEYPAPPVPQPGPQRTPAARTPAPGREAHARTATGRTEIPDPVRLATEPSRLLEPMLAAALSIVASLAAWGSPGPGRTWAPLAVLPAVGLTALLRPGGQRVRVLRAGVLLAVAGLLPVLSPSMTAVTLVIALAVAATYPMLVGIWAGRTVTLLAGISLAVPLVIEALTAPPIDLRVLVNPGAGSLTAVRIALGSGILVVTLIGSGATATRRTLARTAGLAAARERTVRAADAQLNLVTGCDPTTGLPNREALLRTITIALSNRDLAGDVPLLSDTGPVLLTCDPRRRPQELDQAGLILIDIDRFATLADSLGGAAADDIAEQVARRLRADQPAERFLARTGRHQFALLLTAATSESCATVARRITALMATPVLTAGRELSLTCSMGGVRSGHGLETAADLLQAAEEATRAARRHGPSRWVLFDPTVRTEAHDQAGLEIELRGAIRQGLIEAAFQPILALGTGDDDDRIVGAEALARWTREDGTDVEPLRFIPLADELGLGVVLGMQLIEHALAALVRWRHEGVALDQVWVNLAPSQLNDPEFAHEVAAQLAVRGLAASCLVLEISAAVLPESEQARRTLGLLRSLSIAVALDNFGQSGTSLAALPGLPISAVKLDRHLSAELGHEDAVPRSVAQLCQTLGLRVLVVGVETMVQLHGARKIGADAVQGFAIARPMPADDLTNLLTLRLPRNFRLR